MPSAVVAVAVVALVTAIAGGRGDGTEAAKVAPRRAAPIEAQVVKAPPMVPDTSTLGGAPAEMASPGSPAR